MSFDWKGMLRTVAPALATAAGGPLAGIAVREIGKKLLGKDDATEADVAEALARATPEQLVKLREIDTDFRKTVLQAGVKLHELDAADRDSARKREIATHDWTPRVLAFAIVIVWGVIQFHLLTQPLPDGSRDLIMRVLGTLDAALVTVLAYYFGSSSGSRAKTELLAKGSKDSVP